MKFRLKNKFKCKNCRRVTQSAKTLSNHILDCKIKTIPSPNEFLRKVCDNVWIYDNRI